ncbi:MAG: hypothetical protein MJ076_02280 [Clostridia bacterium]|nr:hypothetical protein [Clostridia bacterium]
MKYKHLVTFFLIALPVCIIIRTLQILCTVDGITGFFKHEYRTIGIFMSGLLLVIIGTCAVMCSFIKRCPPKMPKVKPLLGVSSIALGVAVLFEIFTTSYNAGVPFGVLVIADVFGVATAVFFIVYALKMFKDFHIKRKLYIIPVMFFMARLVCVFITASSIALIVDNLFMILCYCSLLLFMLEYAKFANNLDVDMNFKKLFIVGMCSILLCAVSSIPRLIAIISGNTAVLHESVASVITTLIAGVFISAFVFTAYGKDNLLVKKHHKARKTEAPGSRTDVFYFEDEPKEKRQEK